MFSAPIQLGLKLRSHGLRAQFQGMDQFQDKESAMNCEVCAIGERKPQLVRYSLTIDDRLVLIEHVPADDTARDLPAET